MNVTNIKNLYKYYFMEKAKKEERVAEGICIYVRKSLWSVLLEDVAWIKKHSFICMYEYKIKNKRYYKDIKFTVPREEKCAQPYKIHIFYGKRNPKFSYWVPFSDEKYMQQD